MRMYNKELTKYIYTSAVTNTNIAISVLNETLQTFQFWFKHIPFIKNRIKDQAEQKAMFSPYSSFLLITPDI